MSNSKQLRTAQGLHQRPPIVSVQFEERVLGILTRHLSRVTARVILEHCRRVLRDRTRIEPSEQPAFLSAVRTSAWFFLGDGDRAAMGEALDQLEKGVS